MKKKYHAFTLVEILLYLMLFALIMIIIYPLFDLVLTNYMVQRSKLDLRAEIRNIFLRIQREIIPTVSFDILTDWEVVFDKNDEQIAFFQTKPVYLANNRIEGYANNLKVGSIKFRGSNYEVTFSPSSSCAIGTTTIGSVYSFAGYAWSPNIGWIKFRNTPGEPIFGVCQATNGELRGYAWNDIAGWISFNCQDLNVCSSSDYRVRNVNNYLYGYAWNDSLGWLIFDGKGGRIYFAKMNPNIYYLDLISDPNVVVDDLKFTEIGNSFKIDLRIKGLGSAYEQAETAISLPFK
ncbi:MAG: prepilin-type N-terminal cleavage/methylation domain-containing protein [Patescibacteria group bacterium]|nr:prepilin-type N-terminal cleavage/methylation domain-containing protein [Patescibacteria group bacterium]